MTRSSSVPIRWVGMDKKGERVAVCSEYVLIDSPLVLVQCSLEADYSDLLVKVLHVNETTRVSLLSDNTKSIRSATWDPSGKYLVRTSFPRC